MDYNSQLANAYSAGRDRYNDTDPVLFGELEALGVNHQTVVDLGCGDGSHARHILKSGAAKVIGADLSASMIGLAKAKSAPDPKLSFLIADGCRLPIASASVDLVVSNYVLHYFKDTLSVFQEISRILRTGGHFLGTFNITEVQPGFEHLFNQFMPIRLGEGKDSVVVENLMKSRSEITDAIAVAALDIKKELLLDNRHSNVDEAFPFKRQIVKHAVLMLLRR